MVNIERYANKPEITDTEARTALNMAIEQVRRNLPAFRDVYMYCSSVSNFYQPIENTEWTTGFWPGQIWIAYETSGEEVFKEAGLHHVKSFMRRIAEKSHVDHHDMGFMYTPSCTAAYRVAGDETARAAAIMAADQLASRFHEKGAFLQAWGRYGAPNNYRYIIDCMMNLPLMYWAAKETGDPRYAELADRHTATTLAYSIRPDGSTHHTVFMNPETGDFVRGQTNQGYSDSSSWARGQAWSIYGTVLAARYYAKSADAVDAFRRVSPYFLERLPEDLVPYWDLIFTDGDEPRDSSAASIAACGFLEAAKLLGGEESAAYAGIARRIMKSLAETYAVKDPRLSNGQVLHATYSKKSPYNTCTPEGVDECCAWGDYFYMEALARMCTDWQPYW